MQISDFDKAHKNSKSKERKKKDWLRKWLCVIYYLWEEFSTYKVLDKSQIKRSLIHSSFQFSSMYRSCIPKPHKPGRCDPLHSPISQIFLSWMRLLNIVFEDIFLTYSHGFRKGRGVKTFFAHLPKLGKVDRLIQADIVGCF